jgi:MFS superfamily sulfate permease-like transporter
MPNPTAPTLERPAPLAGDLIAGLVVFLVAIPLCLGIALASGAPIISGVISGIIGGIVVGALSGSHVSVAGANWRGVLLSCGTGRGRSARRRGSAFP